MRHFPSPPYGHSAARLQCVDSMQAPFTPARSTVVLALVLAFAAGFFTGAILFGELLVRSARTAHQTSLHSQP